MRSGITKHIGWHTFRHTYTTLLHANGEDVKVLQELLRRGSAKIAMDVYAQAVTARWQADGQHSLKSKNETPK
ncbi:MAG: recombinase, partial [Acidobacteria bacterium]